MRSFGTLMRTYRRPQIVRSPDEFCEILRRQNDQCEFVGEPDDRSPPHAARSAVEPMTTLRYE